MINSGKGSKGMSGFHDFTFHPSLPKLPRLLPLLFSLSFLFSWARRNLSRDITGINLGWREVGRSMYVRFAFLLHLFCQKINTILNDIFLTFLVFHTGWCWWIPGFSHFSSNRKGIRKVKFEFRNR